MTQARLMRPTTTKEPRHEVTDISPTTRAGAAALPRREKECVMPWAKPRQPARVQFDIALVAVGKVAPSPNPRARRNTMSDQNPSARPVKMVAAAQIVPQVPSVRRGPNGSPIHTPMTVQV